MKTKTQRIIDMLIDKGYVEVKSRTSKYHVFFKSGISKRTGKEVDCFYFVGKNAAVRFSNKNCITSAISMTDQFSIRLKNYESKKAGSI